MSASSDDAAPRSKRSDVKDLPAQPASPDDVSGGATIRSAEPCVRPAIDPCWKPAGLPGTISTPIKGH